MLTYKDFNTLTEKQLCKLDGVGKTVAKRIVANRPYLKPKDLLVVKGLGKKTLENLGVLESKQKRTPVKDYYMDGELIDISTKAYAIDTTFKRVDFFWRIPKERRQYLG